MSPSTLTRLLRLLAAIPFVTAVLSAQTRYVNGQTGTDGPGFGATAAQPFRTIGYALASLTPSWGTVYVYIAGDQAYGPGTNGETLPLTLPSTVTLRGEPGPTGQRPTLDLPAGATAFALTAAMSSTGGALQDLVVQGGATGLQCGANAGVSHRVTIERCDFLNQTAAAVSVMSNGGTEDLTLRDCNLRGTPGVAGAGIKYRGPSAWLLLERCRFTGGEGLQLAGRFNGGVPGDFGGLSHFTARGCIWEQTGISSQDDGDYSAMSPRLYTIDDCRFADSGIQVQRTGPGPGNQNALTVTVTATSFVRGGSINFSSGGWGGDATACTISNCAFDSSGVLRCVCGSLLSSSFSFGIYNTVARDFQTAVHVQTSQEAHQVLLEIHGCRMLNGVCAVEYDALSSMSASMRIGNSIFAQCTGDAIRCETNFGAFLWTLCHIGNVTIADCNRGIVMVMRAHSHELSNIAVSGNGTDFVPPPSPQYWPPGTSNAPDLTNCLTDGPPLPGTGNLAVANAGLIRPHYKLAATSPCIDATTFGVGGSDYEGDPRYMAGTPTSVPIADIGADEYAPYGSLRRYGFPGRSRAGVRPSIASNSTHARLGVPYDLRVDQANAPNQTAPSFAFLASGLRDLAYPTPFDLAALGIDGSFLWIDPQDIQTAIPVGANGSAALLFQLPYLPQLAGLAITHQWLVLLPGSLDLVTSDAMRVSFGL
ncbi:MAG: hypothetical protein ACK6D1_18785 [Planctomycetota bacterium]